MNITLYDFINGACDTCYEINVFDNNKGEEILHQVDAGSIEEELENLGLEELLYHEVASWDIGYYSNDKKEELCVNID